MIVDIATTDEIAFIRNDFHDLAIQIGTISFLYLVIEDPDASGTDGPTFAFLKSDLCHKSIILHKYIR